MFADVLMLQAQGEGGGGMINLIFLGVIFVVFYFFLIRPGQKKQKEQKSFSESLEKGDDVVTASGILGRINKIEEGIITLEVGTKLYIRVTKSAISKEMTDGIYAAQDKDKK